MDRTAPQPHLPSLRAVEQTLLWGKSVKSRLGHGFEFRGADKDIIHMKYNGARLSFLPDLRLRQAQGGLTVIVALLEALSHLSRFPLVPRQPPRCSFSNHGVWLLNLTYVASPPHALLEIGPVALRALVEEVLGAL